MDVQQAFQVKIESFEPLFLHNQLQRRATASFCFENHLSCTQFLVALCLFLLHTIAQKGLVFRPQFQHLGLKIGIQCGHQRFA